MARGMRGTSTLLCLFLISAVMQTVAQAPHPPEQAAENSAATQHVQKIQHGVPWREGGPIGFAAPAGAHLSYFGGPVISNVHVVQVLYGSGTYDPQVAGTSSPTMGNFYGDLLGTNSGYITLLSQYDTNISGGTNQIIGNGTFDGLFQIVPSAGNNGSTISDAQIQSELLAQINAGHLPAPLLDAAGNVNTLYMIYFPLGKTITQGGSSSCANGGFCAYHGTTSSTLGGKNLLYGVLPNLSGGICSIGCGSGATMFDNYTSVSSHELSEAITDADVGIATTFAPPLAWYDMTNGEIGDICNAQQGNYTANGTTYTIQLEFSNAANNCVLPPPASSPNFTLSASPSSLSVSQGSTSSPSTITVTDSGGFTGSVTLSASGLPSGVTANFGTNPTTSTSSVTFTASSAATTGTSTVTITGTSGSLTHTTTISLTVNPTASPNFTLSASPSSLSVSQGSTSSPSTITVTDSGGFTGSVTLAASGLPSGVTASFGTNPTTSTSSVTFTASATAATGTSTVTITGTSGSLTHTTTISLTVNQTVVGDFTIVASPSTLTVSRGSSGSYTVTITGNNGFAGVVSLSVSGLGSRVSASFNPSSVTGSGSSTLTIRANRQASRGNRTLTITGTSGSLSHSTTATLTIQ